KLAKEETAEILRLADVKRLRDYVAEADLLWPARPGKVAEMEAWVEKSEDLVARPPQHRATLAELRDRALATPGAAVPTPESRKALEEGQWWNEALSGLVEGIETFASGDERKATLARVKKRLELARTVARRTIDERGDDWRRAIASIQDRA